MAFNARGGIVGDRFGLSLTVFVKGVSEASPVLQGQPLQFDFTHGAYGVKKAAADGVVIAVAKSKVVDPEQPLGVHMVGFSRNIKVKYTGTDLALGDSIVADGAGGYKKAAAANGTVVVLVDTVKKTAEVLIP